jgi:hypothetical protein
VDVGVGVVKVEFISCVDPQPIVIGFTLYVDPPSIKPNFMLKYEVTFGNEHAEDSVNDRLVPKLSNRYKVLL